jgi:r1t holin
MFFKDLLERALKTGAQAALASFGGNAVSLYDINPGTSLGITGFAVLVSVLTSLGSRQKGSKDSASLVE